MIMLCCLHHGVSLQQMIMTPFTHCRADHNMIDCLFEWNICIDKDVRHNITNCPMPLYEK